MNRLSLRYSFSTIIQNLKQKAVQNPMINVIRFENQNKTWTF